MKRLIAPIVALMFLLALSASLVFAASPQAATQTAKPATQTTQAVATTAQPAAQDAAADEAATYKAWYDANNAKDPKAVELAKVYLDKFPNGQYAAYLKKWYASAKTAAATKAINDAVAAKN